MKRDILIYSFKKGGRESSHLLEYVKENIIKNVQVSSFLLLLLKWAGRKAGPVSVVGLDTGRVRVLPPNPNVLEILISPDQTSCVCVEK